MGKKLSSYQIAQKRKLEKEIADTKKYIKKVWGKDIKLKDMSCKEMRELGEELGMNVFQTKKFKSKQFNKKKNKIYIRVCRKCNEYHKIKRNDGIHPKPGYLCMSCRKKVNDMKGEKLKLKNQERWELKVINILTRNNQLNRHEIAKYLEYSIYPILKTLKSLSKKKKIISTKINKTKYYKVTTKE